jgi:anti-sigma regulatory factor (Ser/Thr protein kinase)
LGTEDAMSCRTESEWERQAAPPAASGPLSFRMRVLSDPRLLPVVRSAVSEMATVCGFQEEQCRSITLAVDEALSNILRHAYKNRRDQQIELSCQTHSGYLEFNFVDHGEAADRSRICAQISDENASGGRGTHLIREIMDEVCYERVPEGNRLRLKKHLPHIRSKE